MSEQTNGNLALMPKVQTELDWDTEETRKLIREMYGGKGIPEQDWQLFLAHARAVGLSPLTRQLCVIKFGDRWLPYTTIHGLVHNACKAKNYAGADQVEFDVKPTGNALNGQHPNWARATVYKIVQGVRVAFTAEVYWVERNRGQSAWKTQPWSMLGKCALAAAYRLGWSENSDLYIEEELGIENGRVVESTIVSEQRQATYTPQAPGDQEPPASPPDGMTWPAWCGELAKRTNPPMTRDQYFEIVGGITGKNPRNAKEFKDADWQKVAHELLSIIDAQEAELQAGLEEEDAGLAKMAGLDDSVGSEKTIDADPAND